MPKSPAARAKLFACALAVAVIGLLALLLLRDSKPAAQPKAAVQGSSKAPVSGPFAPASAAGTESDLAAQPLELDVCGLGKQTVVAGVGLPVQLAEREQALHTQAVARMRASGNERASALASWLTASNLLAQAGSDAACGTAGCANTAKNAALTEISQFLNAARNTKDAYVFTLARHACQQIPQRCSEFGVARLVELDPENGNAWLEAAHEAEQRGQTALRNGALYRAAHAQRFDSYYTENLRLAQTGFSAASSDKELLDEALLSMMTFGAAAEISTSAFVGIPALCKSANAPQAEQCKQLAQQIVDKSDTMLGLGWGYSLGKTMGLSAKANQAMRDKVDALYYAGSHTEGAAIIANTNNSLSCNAIKAEIVQWRTMANLGEIGYLEQELVKKGLTTEQAAQRWRAHMLQMSSKLDPEEKKRREAASRNPF